MICELVCIDFLFICRKSINLLRSILTKNSFISILMIVFLPISFLILINFLQNVVQFHLKQLQKFLLTFFVQIVLSGKFLGNFVKMVFILSVKGNPVSFIPQVHIQDQCWGIWLFFLHVLMVIIPSSTWILDALLIGHARLSHRLLIWLLFSAKEVIFILLFLTSLVHSVQGLVNMFCIWSGCAYFFLLQIWSKCTLHIIDLSTDPERLFLTLKTFVVIIKFKRFLFAQFAIEVGYSWIF